MVTVLYTLVAIIRYVVAQPGIFSFHSIWFFYSTLTTEMCHWSAGPWKKTVGFR